MDGKKIILILGLIQVLAFGVILCVAVKKPADVNHFAVVPGVISFQDKCAASFSNIDMGGFIDYRVNLGSFNAGEIEIPAQLQFSSSPEWKSDLLGSHWRAPLFDSSAVAVDKVRIKVVLIDGREIELVRRRYGEGFESNDGQWYSGRFSKDYTLLHKTGAQFHYKSGHIDSFTSGDEEVNWVANGGAVQVSDRGGNTLASLVATDSANPNSATVVVNNRTNLIQLASRSARQTDGVLAVESANEKTLAFDYQHAAPLDSVSITEDRNSLMKMTFDRKTGLAKHIGSWDYEIAARKRNLHTELQITRTNSETGDQETFASNEPGIIRRNLANGAVRVIHYSLASGPQFGKVEKIEEIRKGKSENIFSADYSPEGYIVRAWQKGRGEYLFKHDSRGRIISMQHDGQITLTRAFDENGRVSTFSNGLAGVSMTFSYTNDANITVRIKQNDNPEYVMQADKDSPLFKQVNRIAGF